jgi:hypothetical protein
MPIVPWEIAENRFGETIPLGRVVKRRWTLFSEDGSSLGSGFECVNILRYITPLQGEFPLLGTVLPTLGPQGGQTAKGRRRTSVLFRTPKSKNTYGPSHIGFNLGQNPDSIGLLAPAGPNVGSTSKPTHD